eukprot:2655644-Alexandrium_andersonii.AAC.1
MSRAPRATDGGADVGRQPRPLPPPGAKAVGKEGEAEPGQADQPTRPGRREGLSLIHISEPTRLALI